MSAKTVQQIADGLSESQRLTLLAGDADNIEAPAGTWFMPRRAKLFDADFNVTSLGAAVRDELRRRAASA